MEGGVPWTGAIEWEANRDSLSDWTPPGMAQELLRSLRRRMAWIERALWATWSMSATILPQGFKRSVLLACSSSLRVDGSGPYIFLELRVDGSGRTGQWVGTGMLAGTFSCLPVPC